jgi:hypothetical protein
VGLGSINVLGTGWGSMAADDLPMPVVNFLNVIGIK